MTFVGGVTIAFLGKWGATQVERFRAQSSREERAEEREFKEAESIRAELRRDKEELKRECEALRRQNAQLELNALYLQQRILHLWNEANRCRERDGLPPLPAENLPPPIVPSWGGPDQAPGTVMDGSASGAPPIPPPNRPSH